MDNLHNQRLMQPLFLVPTKHEMATAEALNLGLSSILSREAAAAKPAGEYRLVQGGESQTGRLAA